MTTRPGVRGRAATAATTAILVALGFGLAGCGGGDEETIVTDDATVKLDQGDDGSIEIESSEGTMTITGETDELPEGWPAEVVLPAGGSVTSSMEMTGEGQEGWVASLSYPELSAADLADQVAAGLADSGFEQKAKVSTDQGVMGSYEGSGYVVTAMASAEGSGSTLSVTIATQ